MKIAVTGATGHIASVLIPMLIAEGHSVRALVHQHNAGTWLTGAETVHGSLYDFRTLHELVQSCNVVIHTAARISINSNADPEVYDTNVKGTMNLFSVSAENGVKRFLHISSIHAYRQSPANEPLDENRAYCSDNAPCYDRSKRDAEQYVLQHASAGMEAIVLIPTAVTGPFDHRPSLLGKAIMDMYNHKVPALVNGGFDFCDVRDVATGIMKAIQLGNNANAYLLSGKWYSLKNFHKLVMDTRGEKSRLPVIPGWVGKAGLPFTGLYARLKKEAPLYTRESLDTLLNGNTMISSKRANAELGYSCRPLQETVQDTINWFRQAGKLA